MKVQQMKMMKRLKEQMAQLQEAAEERARQAEKDKVSTLWYREITDSLGLTTRFLYYLFRFQQLELENGGGKTSTPEEEDDVQKEYDIHNARKK